MKQTKSVTAKQNGFGFFLRNSVAELYSQCNPSKCVLCLSFLETCYKSITISTITSQNH